MLGNTKGKNIPKARKTVDRGTKNTVLGKVSLYPPTIDITHVVTAWRLAKTR